jgi:hypothetical protein
MKAAILHCPSAVFHPHEQRGEIRVLLVRVIEGDV